MMLVTEPPPDWVVVPIAQLVAEVKSGDWGHLNRPLVLSDRSAFEAQISRERRSKTWLQFQSAFLARGVWKQGGWLRVTCLSRCLEEARRKLRAVRFLSITGYSQPRRIPYPSATLSRECASRT